MTGNATLRIAAFISLGIHLLFLVIVSNLFRHPRVLRMDTPYVKVILHPLASQEKPDVKIIPPVPLRVGDRDGVDPSIGRKEPNEDSLSLPTSVAKAIPFEPRPVSKNKEEEEVSDDSANIVVTAPGSLLDNRSNLENQGNRNSSERPAPNVENDSASPALRSGEFDGGTFSYSSSGEGKGSGNGMGHTAGIGRGYGRQGILGKMFSSRGGDNGARPRYVENPKPNYPQEAREKGHQGEVVLRVEVLVNGQVGQIQIKKSSGYELLDHSALTTVKQWRFIPAKKGDAFIPLWVNIPIKFQLQ